MHILKPGHVKVERDGGHGQILFTETTFFALRTCNNAAITGAVLGGLVGALIGNMIDSKRAKKTPSEHLNHPEIVTLDTRTRKQLLTTKLVCSIPLSGDFVAKQTGMGFTFSAAGHPDVVYKGYFHKKRILAFLKERGISVIACL